MIETQELETAVESFNNFYDSNIPIDPEAYKSIIFKEYAVSANALIKSRFKTMFNRRKRGLVSTVTDKLDLLNIKDTAKITVHINKHPLTENVESLDALCVVLEDILHTVYRK